jgi:CRP-like cAMP-binding protein
VHNVICQEGVPADKLYFLVSGRVSVSLQLDYRHQRRLSAYTAGWAFGESALFNNYKRTAEIQADTPVHVYSLDPGKLDAVGSPLALRVRMKLINNLSEISLLRLERANREIRFLTT